MNSDFIKLRLLEYYRFKRAMLVGTEVGVNYGIADVLAISMDNSRSIEIEVKVSISDLRADFKNKTAKHLLAESGKWMVPNYFSFAVPEELLEKTLKILEDKNSKYGVITISEDGDIKTIKKASRLNKSPNDKLKHYLDLRINNQLITTLQKKEEMLNENTHR